MLLRSTRGGVHSVHQGAHSCPNLQRITVPAGLKTSTDVGTFFPGETHRRGNGKIVLKQSSPVDLTPTRPHLPLMFMEQSRQNRIRRLQQAKAPYISRSPSATELRFPSHPLRQKLLLGSCDLCRGGRRNVCGRVFPHQRTSRHLPD